MDVELLCDKECIICLDNKENEWLPLECRHEYHKKCIQHWMRIRMTCPICVQVIPSHHCEIIEHVAENDDATCERGMSNLICVLLCVALICIVVGSIISIYS